MRITNSSAKDGTKVRVTAKAFGYHRPGGTTPVKNPVVCFDVLVRGLSDGEAHVHITDPSVVRSSKMWYWKGRKWVLAPRTKVTKNTIKATIPVADLDRTPIIVGT